MAPEQFQAQQVTQTADLYSFGCVLYEMLTGAPPFVGQTYELGRKHVDENLAPVRLLRSEVPEGFGRLVERLPARKAANRPTDAAVMREARLATAEEVSLPGCENFASVRGLRTARAERQSASGPVRPPAKASEGRQFSTSVSRGAVLELADRGVLHGLCAKIFQSKASTAAQSGASYVLTTGTGSAKSLSYMVPIIDKALEDDAARKEIRYSPSDILLTNYVMLELMLTRPDDRRSLVRMAEGLQFLVFDELHTYRGCQGADVSLLIIRVREACRAEVLQCVGTSATMSSEGTADDQKAVVADVASTLFGTTVHPEHVIGETQVRATGASPDTVPANRLKAPAPSRAYAELECDPLARWIETRLGLATDATERPVRWHHGPPYQWDEERRDILRAELDAALFHLYGVARRDVGYVLETIPVVRRKDEAPTAPTAPRT